MRQQPLPQKSLGQHWLRDESVLLAMVTAAAVNTTDTVLEVGPGLGTLTTHLCAAAKRVIAVEADIELAAELPRRVTAANLAVVAEDILMFDFTSLPKDYKLVANIPYYLTSKLIRNLLESANPPQIVALLVQKEVAERITATQGEMSLLACSVQYYSTAETLQIVDKTLFEPIPKVDSAILRLMRRPQPVFPAEPKKLFRLIKAGFGERRKLLANSLAGALRLSKPIVTKLLVTAELDPLVRAQELSMEQWGKLYETAVSKELI